MTGSPERKRFVTVAGRDVEPRITTNGLCAVEASFGGVSLEELGKQMAGGRTSAMAVRAVFRSILLPELPDLSDVQAGRLLSEIGTEEAACVIQSAFDAWKGGANGPKAEISEPTPKGEVSFEAGGQRYKLAFAFNALAEMEPVFPGMTMPQIAAALLEGGVSVLRMRAMFRGALIDYLETSLFEAGEIIDAIGMATASEAVGKAFLAAFPKVPENEGDQDGQAEGGNRATRRAAASAKDANPTPKPRRKGGTGTP